MWKLRLRKSRNFPRIKGLIEVAEAMALVQTFDPKSSVLPTPPTPTPCISLATEGVRRVWFAARFLLQLR